MNHASTGSATMLTTITGFFDVRDFGIPILSVLLREESRLFECPLIMQSGLSAWCSARLHDYIVHFNVANYKQRANLNQIWLASNWRFVVSVKAEDIGT